MITTFFLFLFFSLSFSSIDFAYLNCFVGLILHLLTSKKGFCVRDWVLRLRGTK